jgi:hypothetical protein
LASFFASLRETSEFLLHQSLNLPASNLGPVE